jgi:hypothetical protein
MRFVRHARKTSNHGHGRMISGGSISESAAPVGRLVMRGLLLRRRLAFQGGLTGVVR